MGNLTKAALTNLAVFTGLGETRIGVVIVRTFTNKIQNQAIT